MRPGQNKRMRGRNNNNNGGRKGPNPLTRSYESNGPDVKIRGTAQHIGEKYLQLARDAQTSGDPVAAESYLQHAEHYFRLIAAAQLAQQQVQGGFVRQPGEAEADEGDDEDDFGIPDRFASPVERAPVQPVPPPYPDRQPQAAERTNPERQNPERFDRPERGERQDGPDRGPRQERPGNYDREPRQDRGQDRHFADRNNGYDRPGQERQQRFDRNDRGNRQNRFPREFSDQRDTRDPQYRDQPRIPAAPRDPEPRVQPAAVEPESDLPAFITAPVRIVPPQDPVPDTPRDVEAAAVGEAPVGPEGASDDNGETFAVRPRRRRRPRLASTGGPEAGSVPGSDENGEG